LAGSFQEQLLNAKELFFSHINEQFQSHQIQTRSKLPMFQEGQASLRSVTFSASLRRERRTSGGFGSERDCLGILQK